MTRKQVLKILQSKFDNVQEAPLHCGWKVMKDGVAAIILDENCCVRLPSGIWKFDKQQTIIFCDNLIKKMNKHKEKLLNKDTKKQYIQDVTVQLRVQGRLCEERWWKKIPKKLYDKIKDFIYDELTKD